VSDEPLYCTTCGLEWGDCAHPLPGDAGYSPGPFCEVCGIIPAPGHQCDETGKPCRSEADL
jgi:hypothetical protein